MKKLKRLSALLAALSIFAIPAAKASFNGDESFDFETSGPIYFNGFGRFNPDGFVHISRHGGVVSISTPDHVTPAAQSRPATPAAQSRPATPAAQSRPATPAAQSRPATPAAQSRPATPAAQSRPATPAAQSRPAVPVGGYYIGITNDVRVADLARMNRGTYNFDYSDIARCVLPMVRRYFRKHHATDISEHHIASWGQNNHTLSMFIRNIKCEFIRQHARGADFYFLAGTPDYTDVVNILRDLELFISRGKLSMISSLLRTMDALFLR